MRRRIAQTRRSIVAEALFVDEEWFSEAAQLVGDGFGAGGTGRRAASHRYTGLEQGHRFATEGGMGLDELGEREGALEGVTHEAGDDAMGLPERHPLLHKELSEVDGGCRRRVGRVGHALEIE